MTEIAVGSRWWEEDTSRTVIVRNVGTQSVYWYYEDDRGQTIWHCGAEDFLLWKRFKLLSTS